MEVKEKYTGKDSNDIIKILNKIFLKRMIVVELYKDLRVGYITDKINISAFTFPYMIKLYYKIYSDAPELTEEEKTILFPLTYGNKNEE